MPWTLKDVDAHVKGLSAKQKRVWLAIANSALKKCQDNGGANCDASALKQAAAVAQRVGESERVARDLERILVEKGRVLSADNEKAIRTALAAIQAVLAKVATDDQTAAEAALDELPDLAAVLREAEMSFNDRERAIRGAIKASRPLGYCWLRDVYDDRAIFEIDSQDGANGKTYQVSYAIADDGTVTLGDPIEVRPQVVYTTVGQQTTEATHTPPLPTVELSGGLVPLVEKAIRRDGTVPLKIIQPGWGSSGYYSPEILERDGPKAFTKGLHLYWNHPSVSEESDRPERDLRDLAAVLESDATWKAEGPAGPGLYADAKVFQSYAKAIEDLAPHIGVSIRAMGRIAEGTAEGRSGPIVEELSAGKSVDFVTAPGAGGQILELFEAARGGRPISTPGGTEVTEQEAQQLREAATTAQTQLTEANQKISGLESTVARMQEGLLLRDARAFVATALAAIQLPEMTRARLAESLALNPPIKDGALDTETYQARIKEAAAAELEYLAKVSGVGSGAIRNLGSTEAAEVTAEEADKRLKESMTSLLGSETAGLIAATGRA